MKQDSVKKNFALQIIYQIIVLAFPLIVSPILTRTIGKTNLGIYTFVNSIAYYFVLVANLGILTHGQRVISKAKDDEVTLRKTFWSLVVDHSVVSLVSIAAYCAFTFFFFKENQNIFWIQLLYVSTALFDLTWLFYGLESFKSVVIKNMITKIISLVLIIIFVHEPDDLPIYAFIEGGSLLLGYLLVVPSAFKAVKPIKFGWVDCKQHIKPMLVLFISVVASTLYTVFDKTLLGLMATKEDVAIYEYSNKIVGLPKTLAAVIGTVLFPRACALAKKGDVENQNRYASYGYITVAAISFASIFGLIAIGELFAVIYYGEEFADCGYVIMALSPLILIVTLGDILRNVYLVPYNKDKEFIISLCVSAVVNIALSAALIPTLGIYGAVIGTVSAETVGLTLQFIFCRKMLEYKKIFIPIAAFMVDGGIMLGILFLVRFLLGHFGVQECWWTLLMMVGIGALVYIALAIVIVKVFFKELDERIKNFLKSKFHRKEKVAE